MNPARPHVLGIDDGAFEKGQREPVPLVAVMMEGADLVEAIALERFPVDGDDVTVHLSGWVRGLRCFPALQAVMLSGVTIAGLAIVDTLRLSHELGLPVLVVTRRDPVANRVADALRAAGREERMEILARAREARRAGDGLFVAAAGASFEEALALVRATVRKAALPEPLRVAHLVGRALAHGESRGRA